MESVHDINQKPATKPQRNEPDAGFLETIPQGVSCCSQFGHGQRATTGAYTQDVRMTRFARPKEPPQAAFKIPTHFV